MDENKEKNYQVEWSFSFEKLGEQIGDFFKSVTDKSEEEIKRGEFSTPLDGAASARVRIDFSVGESTLEALDSADNLLEADLTYIGEIQLEATGEAEKVVHLSQKAAPADWVRSAIGWIGSNQSLRWDIGLTPNVPLDLDLNAGAGQSKYDLSGLQVSALDVSSGAGEVTLHLADGRYNARFSGGVGQSNINVPSGADVDLNISSGAGEINLDIADGAVVRARIRGGVGQTNVHVPADAAVRLEAKTGIGSINTKNALRRVRGGGDFLSNSGVWETDGFESAANQITIRFEGGVGELNVR